MRLIQLAARNLGGSSFRSWLTFFCAALMAGFVISSTLVIRGADKSLRLALERLGADIIVIPAGNEARLQSALLMGVPARWWMPEEVQYQIGSLPDVTAVSPQIYLATLRGATCCSLPEMFLIAYDPDTDFTLRPWLEGNLADGLQLGQAVGGSYVYVPSGQDQILVYGYGVDLAGNLAPTGTGLDQSMFLTFETAYEIARLSPLQAEQPLDIPAGQISSALVKVALDADTQQVARQIASAIPGVTAIETANLFKKQRTEILGLLNSVVLLLGISWILAMALIALVFSIAVNERRREIGVMRALGATRTTVLRSLLLEAALLALAGGIVGIAVTGLAVFLFRNLIIGLMGVPFLLPTPLNLLALGLGGLALVLASVIVAALFPTLRISLQDPAMSMRE
jgi:putative ABC transport system permease protein